MKLFLILFALVLCPSYALAKDSTYRLRNCSGFSRFAVTINGKKLDKPLSLQGTHRFDANGHSFGWATSAPIELYKDSKNKINISEIEASEKNIAAFCIYSSRSSIAFVLLGDPDQKSWDFELPTKLPSKKLSVIFAKNSKSLKHVVGYIAGYKYISGDSSIGDASPGSLDEGLYNFKVLSEPPGEGLIQLKTAQKPDEAKAKEPVVIFYATMANGLIFSKQWNYKKNKKESYSLWLNSKSLEPYVELDPKTLKYRFIVYEKSVFDGWSLRVNGRLISKDAGLAGASRMTSDSYAEGIETALPFPAKDSDNIQIVLEPKDKNGHENDFGTKDANVTTFGVIDSFGKLYAILLAARPEKGYTQPLIFDIPALSSSKIPLAVVEKNNPVENVLGVVAGFSSVELAGGVSEICDLIGLGAGTQCIKSVGPSVKPGNIKFSLDKKEKLFPAKGTPFFFSIQARKMNKFLHVEMQQLKSKPVEIKVF